MKVLLIEDDHDLRSVLASCFEDADCQVVSCEGAHEAIKLLEENVFDLVLSDIKMSKGSGVDLLIAIRDNPKIKTPKNIYMMSGYAEIGPDEILSLGANHYFSKPLIISEVLDKYDKTGND